MKKILIAILGVLSMQSVSAQNLLWTALANPDSLQVNGVGFSVNNAQVLSGTNCHPAHIRLYSAVNGLQEWDYTVPGNLMCQMGVSFSSDGKYFASVEEMGNIILFDYTQAVPDSIMAIAMGTSYAFAIAFSPNANKMLVGASNGKLQTYAAASGAQDLNIVAHSSWVTAVTYSPDNLLIASGGNDNLVKIWDTSGLLKHTLTGHTNDICSVKFSADNSKLFSASHDKRINVWDVATGALVHTINTGALINAMDMTDDGKVLAIVSADKWIRLYNTTSYNCVDSFVQAHGVIPLCVDFSGDNHYLVTGTSNGLVTNYDVSKFTDVKDVLAKDRLLVYPNPFYDVLNIESVRAYSTMELYDLNGRKQLTAEWQQHKAKIPACIGSGVYVLKLYDKKGQVATCLVQRH